MIPDHNRHCDIATLSSFDIEDRMCVIGANLDISREHTVFSDVYRAALKSSHIDSPCRAQSLSNGDIGPGADKNGAPCVTGANVNFCIPPSELDHDLLESGVRGNYKPVATPVKLNVYLCLYVVSRVDDPISMFIVVIFQSSYSGWLHDLCNGVGHKLATEGVSTRRSLPFVRFRTTPESLGQTA